MTTSAADARAYLDRWTLVKERECMELRTTSMDTKARQLASLMESRELFGADPLREPQVNDGRETWARLRHALNG